MKKELFEYVSSEMGNHFAVVYDKKTKVMYAMNNEGYTTGVLTMLVNADGSPRLWEEENESDN